MAAVKANAYGHGIVEFSRAALECGVSWLGVINAYEARKLRDAKISAPILTFFEPEPEEIEWLIENNVSITCFTERTLELVAARGSRSAPAHVHIKVNTGMNRQGSPPERAIDLAKRAARTASIELEGVYSHLATAEFPNDSFAETQVRRFEEVRANLSDLDIPYFHLANTGGTLFYPQARYDMVRVGIGLYGYLPNPAVPAAVTLKPALSLKCKLSAVNDLEPGDGVSYGLHWKAAAKTRVGVCPVGYGDGLFRSLGGKLEIFAAGRGFPSRGIMCMDQFIVDLGDSPLGVGDEVEIIGAHVTAQDIAVRAGTIAYEVLARLAERLPRVYVD
jgi:alanine racemase